MGLQVPGRQVELQGAAQGAGAVRPPRVQRFQGEGDSEHLDVDLMQWPCAFQQGHILLPKKVDGSMVGVTRGPGK